MQKQELAPVRSARIPAVQATSSTTAAHRPHEGSEPIRDDTHMGQEAQARSSAEPVTLTQAAQLQDTSMPPAVHISIY